MSNLIIWLIVLIVAVLVAAGVLYWSQVKAEDFAHFGQGMAGVVAAVGILVGGALFIAEGRTRPKLVLQVTSTVIGTTASPGPQQSVYVQVVTTIENRGSLGAAVIDCAAFDAFAIAPSEERSAQHANDLTFESLLGSRGHHGVDWDRCLAKEEREAEASSARPGSGFRWATFAMRPGQIRTRNFELVVPCSMSGLRILVKIPDPDGGVLERKLAISIVDVCRGESVRDVTSVADTDSSPTQSISSQPADVPATANAS